MTHYPIIYGRLSLARMALIQRTIGTACGRRAKVTDCSDVLTDCPECRAALLREAEDFDAIAGLAARGDANGIAELRAEAARLRAIAVRS